MRFYKILKQLRPSEESFCNLLESERYEYIIGNYSNSFAVIYSPEMFNKLLNNNVVFREFRTKAIQQLFVTNQKFLTITKYLDFFDMEIIDCVFSEDINNIFLEEYDEVSLESIEDIVLRHDFTIKRVTYRTNDNKRTIILQNNGVIGIDNGLSENENKKVLSLIDTLNFGLRVMEK